MADFIEGTFKLQAARGVECPNCWKFTQNTNLCAKYATKEVARLYICWLKVACYLASKSGVSLYEFKLEIIRQLEAE